MQYITVYRPEHLADTQETIYGVAWASWSPRYTHRFVIKSIEKRISIHVPHISAETPPMSEHRLYVALALSQKTLYASRALKFHGTAYLSADEFTGDLSQKRRILRAELRYTASYRNVVRGVLPMAVGAIVKSTEEVITSASGEEDTDLSEHEDLVLLHSTAMRDELQRVSEELSGLGPYDPPEYDEVFRAFVPHYMTRCFSMPTAAFSYFPSALQSGSGLFFVRAAQIACSRFAVEWRTVHTLSLQHQAEVVGQAIHGFCAAMPYVTERVDQYRSAGAIGSGDCDDFAATVSRLWLTLSNSSTAHDVAGNVEERRLFEMMIRVARLYTVLMVVGTASSGRMRSGKHFTTGHSANIYGTDYNSQQSAGHFYVMCVPNEIASAWKGGSTLSPFGKGDERAPVLLLDAASPIPVLPLSSEYYRHRKLSERVMGRSAKTSPTLRSLFYRMDGEVKWSASDPRDETAPLSHFYRFVSWVYEASANENEMPREYVMTRLNDRLGVHYRDMITGSNVVRMRRVRSPVSAALWESTRLIREAHDAPFWDFRADTTFSTPVRELLRVGDVSTKKRNRAFVFYRWHSISDNYERIVSMVRQIMSEEKRTAILYEERWGETRGASGSYGTEVEKFTTLRLEIYR